MKNKIGLLGMSASLLTVLFFALGGCGSSSSDSEEEETVSVSGTASFLNGPTPASGSSSINAIKTPVFAQALTTPSDGNWLLSPDQMILTLTSIDLTTDSDSTSGTLSDSACTITYDRSQVGLAQLVECPFTVAPGTYTSILLGFDATYQVLIDDSTNGFWTTSSGITTGEAPAAGAEYLSVTTTSSGDTFGNTSYLASPLTVAEGDTVTVSIVISGLQFFRVSVSSGIVSLGGDTNSDPFRPDMTASVTAPASLGFYVAPEIGTALSYNSTAAGAAGITSVSVYYSSATTPTTLFLGLNGSPSNCPVEVAGAINGPPNDNTLGGYLGLDSDDVLGWALPTDNLWTTYATEFNMAQLTTLGETTQLNCEEISTDPAPSGNTFASGAPTITSPDYSTDMMLVAQ